MNDSSLRELLVEADALEAAGHHRDLIDVLRTVNTAERDDEVERRLIRVRRRAAADLIEGATPEGWPPPGTRATPTGHVPEIDADALDAETLRRHLFTDGTLLVRGFATRDECSRLVALIDRGFDAWDRHLGGGNDTLPWYHQCEFDRGADRNAFRYWAHRTGAMLAADSPPVLHEHLELLERHGMRELATAYFNEPPLVSAGKTTLRRTPLEGDSAWHQDGAFLGEEIRALNVWLALTDCGVDAPGLDVIPRRLDHIVETGTDPAYPWAVGDDVVAREGFPVESPRFASGDALIFDEMMLHRTQRTPDMTRVRYALETWFFPPSSYPDSEVPLAF